MAPQWHQTPAFQSRAVPCDCVELGREFVCSAGMHWQVRTSIVCGGSSQILQIMRWFTSTQAGSCLRVVRIKNIFASTAEEILDGWARILFNLQTIQLACQWFCAMNSSLCGRCSFRCFATQILTFVMRLLLYSCFRYRDLSLSVLFTGEKDLWIIGEIQVFGLHSLRWPTDRLPVSDDCFELHITQIHNKTLYNLKTQVILSSLIFKLKRVVLNEIWKNTVNALKNLFW